MSQCKSVSQAHSIELLNGDRGALKQKCCLSSVSCDGRDATTDIGQELHRAGTHGSESLHGHWVKVVRLTERAVFADLSCGCSLGCTGRGDGALPHMVSTTVTSHVAQRPECHGRSVRPSGRLPSSRTRPCGSFMAGIPARVTARHIRSLMKLCLCMRPRLLLHEKACRPSWSTTAPQRQLCC